jgi:hypothetical protein
LTAAAAAAAGQVKTDQHHFSSNIGDARASLAMSALLFSSLLLICLASLSRFDNALLLRGLRMFHSSFGFEQGALTTLPN